jgi:hypothetical protein
MRSAEYGYVLLKLLAFEMDVKSSIAPSHFSFAPSVFPRISIEYSLTHFFFYFFPEDQVYSRRPDETY